MKEFSPITRKKDIEDADQALFDLLIIGGGITGAGIANILSANGISAILVEKGDFGSGTSQGSSKLIHGGLRYLQEQEFRLVRELLKERNYILSNVKASRRIKFNILIGKSTWKRSTIRAGLFLYNILGGKFSIPRFHKNDKKYPEEFDGYFAYEDGWCDDALLVIYNIVTAHENGAVCLNYAEFKDVTKEEGYFSSKVYDSIGKKTIDIKSKMIINCSGPWAEKIAEKTGTKGNLPFRLSKGVHIVVSRRKFPLDSGIVFMSQIDRRQMFIIPAGEVIVIGTTDNFTDNPENLETSQSDVEYIVNSAKQVIPDLTLNDIITSYAGIRPLIGDSEDPGKLPRDFLIQQEGKIINVYGGKLTNYRVASRKVARIVSSEFGLKFKIRGMPRISYERPDTKDRYIHEIMYECAMFPEDILRRREAFTVYREDKGKSEENSIRNAFKDVKK